MNAKQVPERLKTWKVHTTTAGVVLTPAPATSELWRATHTALYEGRWSAARGLLEDLARRNDYTDKLSAMSAYITGRELRGMATVLDRGFVQLLDDRIDAVNVKADRNARTPPFTLV